MEIDWNGQGHYIAGLVVATICLLSLGEYNAGLLIGLISMVYAGILFVLSQIINIINDRELKQNV